MLPLTVSPLALAVSIPPLSLVASCTERLLSCSYSEAGSDALHQNHSFFEFWEWATVNNGSTC